MHYLNKKVLGTVISVLSVIGFSSIAFADSGVINGDSVKVRSGSGTGYREVELLDKGQKVEILKVSDDWYNIKFNNKSGWVFSKFVTKAPETRSYVVTSAENVNLRSGPSTDHRVIDSMKVGSKADIIEIGNGWYKVKNPDGKVGWVLNTLVKVKSSTTSRGTTITSGKSIVKPVATTNAVKTPEVKAPEVKTSEVNNNDIPVEKEISSKDQELVDNAIKLLGTKYVYGGSSTNGFDCSGFVKYVYAKEGINLNRTSRDQAANGYAISRDSIKPGDLLFFDTSKKGHINHVGIYIGDNKFIHSSSAKHKVRISELDDFYSKTYRGARRIVN